MCGITGLFHSAEAAPVNRALLQAMTDRIAHRGPDGDGFLVEPGVGLGHRRLAIIDLSTGDQPIWNETDDVGIVFNGEIYNFHELFDELRALGHVFRTKSDTEAIVHAYEQWGAACVQRLRGMFAFAIWDRRRQTLFIARDRLGKKPLYYAILPGGWLAFASELKALEVLPDLSMEIDQQAIEDYFALGYIADPRSVYRAVRKLPPAHIMTVERGRPPRIERYWRLDCTAEERIDPVEARDELLRILGESVRIRMISDVPLGAFLSGGVDSSGIVALMARQSGDPVKTFTVGFGESAFDETPHAAEVAARYRTDHTVRRLSPDMTDVVDGIAGMYDEPFGDSSALPTYLVCKAARERVTVALSGDAGDELFAGYRRYMFHARESALRKLMPLGLRRPLFGTLARIYPKLDNAPQFLRARTTFEDLSLTDADGYANNVAVIKRSKREALYADRFRRGLAGYDASSIVTDAMTESGSDDPVTAAQYADLMTYLPGDILTKVDRASMAASLEVRVPMLDHKFVEFAFRLPRHMKLDGAVRKKILKDAFRPLVPEGLLDRPKQGFSVPLSKWFRGPLRDSLRHAVESPDANDLGFLDRSHVRRLYQEHVDGRADHTQALWLTFGLARFAERLAGRRPAAPPAPAPRRAAI